MKTRNLRYPRSSGMNGDKSIESGAFLFSRLVPDFCDGRQSFSTNENSNLYRRGRRRWISLITNSLNCWAPVPLSQINMASVKNLGWSVSQWFGYPRVFGYPRTQIPSVLGIPSRDTQNTESFKYRRLGQVKSSRILLKNHLYSYEALPQQMKAF